uniref:Uncharacterized protein n=1 Tax=Loa loa TaxID=7209 RepID=A0A1I7V8B9_LOALO
MSVETKNKTEEAKHKTEEAKNKTEEADNLRRGEQLQAFSPDFGPRLYMLRSERRDLKNRKLSRTKLHKTCPSNKRIQKEKIRFVFS